MSCSQIQSRVSMDQPLIIPGELGEALMIFQHAPSDLQLFQQLGPNDVLAHSCASCIVAHCRLVVFLPPPLLWRLDLIVRHLDRHQGLMIVVLQRTSEVQLFQQLAANNVPAHFCASCIVESFPTSGILAPSTPVER
jgi:hypothetical protein